VTRLHFKRQPHAVFDLNSRAKKALKIERLLGLRPSSKPLKMLEIGTGSGGIAHYFAHHPSIEFDVTAVDVVDQRQARDGYRFVKVDDTHIPFADASFDIVLSNHVIEHVGDSSQQHHHLCEIRRVLRPGGVGYLAVPNRWMLIEPHYRLIFLSWLPPAWRSPYLRLLRRGHFYDCQPLTLPQIEQALSIAGLDFEYLGTRAIREFSAIEAKHGPLWSFLAALPDKLLDRFAAANPTLIYRIWRDPETESEGQSRK